MDRHAEINRTARPLRETEDLDPLMERIGDARYVLIGEASHGTYDYYAWRALLTKRLIRERGFSFVGVEGDWPDCYRVNASVTLTPDAPEDPSDPLHDFDRWPTWMWANREVVDFTRWLRSYNADLPAAERVGFYGLDVYSLWDSLQETLDYMQRFQPDHAESARQAFRCFEPYAEDPQQYARATRLVPDSCEDDVVRLLADLRSAATDAAAGRNSEAHFNAEQNALTAAGAEAYYRAMVRGGPESWNLRDRHMFETLRRLVDFHTSRAGTPAKAVVWEHNTHVGDARWTDMAGAGMLNVGQLVREAHADDGVVIVGFGSHRGKVVAADYWGGRTHAMRLPRAREDSVEALLHEALEGQPSSLFLFGDQPPDWASERRGHRAVGVVYDPRAESWGNYVPTVLGRRYDSFIWIDKTAALHPLHGVHPHGDEMEAWPTGK